MRRRSLVNWMSQLLTYCNSHHLLLHWGPAAHSIQFVGNTDFKLSQSLFTRQDKSIIPVDRGMRGNFRIFLELTRGQGRGGLGVILISVNFHFNEGVNLLTSHGIKWDKEWREQLRQVWWTDQSLDKRDSAAIIRLLFLVDSEEALYYRSDKCSGPLDALCPAPHTVFWGSLAQVSPQYPPEIINWR